MKETVELAQEKGMQGEKRIEKSDGIFRRLAQEALRAARFSYSPYSGFQVGAALLTEEGQIYTGCNIENAAYGPSVCAERTAIFKAVSEGHRRFRALAVTGGPNGAGAIAPCGVCRQVMKEFCKPDFPILFVESEEKYELHTLGELLPYSFGAEQLTTEHESRHNADR